MCFYDMMLKCILPSMTLRTVKLKPLEYFVKALHYSCSIHSWKNISWICILITPYFLRLREQVTINIVVVVLPSVLLNCRGAYYLSCWTAMVFTICPVELMQCSPSVLLNCWGAYLLYCQTATMLPIFPVELMGYIPSVLLNCYICLPSVLLNHLGLPWSHAAALNHLPQKQRTRKWSTAHHNLSQPLPGTANGQHFVAGLL